VFLHTGEGRPPPELVKYRLRMMYKCTPSELDAQRGKYLSEMMQDLLCQTMEIKAAK
jgi:hypothetical protein